jgi:beta-N-acetylglucosaminidase
MSNNKFGIYNVKVISAILMVAVLLNALISVNTFAKYSETKKQLTEINRQIAQLDSLNNEELMKTEEGSIENISLTGNNAIAADTAMYIIENTESTENDDIIIEEVSSSINTTDITKPSNLSADQLNNMINSTLKAKGKKSSTLYNTGTAFYNMEHSYNVNALFALAVASLEGAWGTSSAAKKKNNPFGIYSKGKSRSFSSTGEGINYFGSLISNSYIAKGYNTISKINSKYCPGNSKWTSYVTSIMKSYAAHI